MKAIMPPPAVVDDSTGKVGWAGQQRAGDGITDVLLVVDYDPDPDFYLRGWAADRGSDRVMWRDRMSVFPGTLGVPEEARRDVLGLWGRLTRGTAPNTTWVLRIGRMEYDGWLSNQPGPRRALNQAIPIFDVVDRHSGGLWRLGMWSEAIDHPNGFIHCREAEPRPCTYRPGDLPEDRYAAALAITGWDQYL